MIVFRFHRGSLKESLDTAKEFNSVEEMDLYIKKWAHRTFYMRMHFYPYDLKHEFYCFDDRLNTNDYIVTMYNRVSGNYEVVGMYSENATLKSILGNYIIWDTKERKRVMQNKSKDDDMEDVFNYTMSFYLSNLFKKK